MSFTLPTFNLPADIYTGPWLTKTLRFTELCNLAFGKRIQLITYNYDAQILAGQTFMQILFPALTDIRGAFQGLTPDILEVPSGSGRWYFVAACDDAGKGFENEHRVVIAAQLFESIDSGPLAGSNWPVPMP